MGSFTQILQHLRYILLGLVLVCLWSATTTLPLWSQTPEPINSPPPAQVGVNGTYETVACSTLATLPGDTPDPEASIFSVSEEAVEGTDYECGYLTVPELHRQPEGNMIQVGIVILKSTNPNPAEPLLLFQGGPGGSSINLFPSSFLSFGEQILAERDVIVFEKRGNLYSRPFLDCPEYREDNSFAEVTLEESVQTLKACRDRLVQEGVNPAAFNSFESAHDVAALAEALGYDQVNLYGVSYGTELVQDILRLYPDLARSVILDGVVPSDVSIDSQYAVIMDRLITQVDAACAKDADCNAQFPDVKETFEATYARLNQSPEMVPFAGSNGIEARAIGGSNLADTIFLMSYSSGAPFIFPALIYQASEGNYSIVLKQQNPGGSSGIAKGTYFSVKCAEDTAYTDGLDRDGVTAPAADWGGKVLESMEAKCEVWDVPALDPISREAVVSDVPTLIWNGDFDPITPPPFGKAVAQGFSNHTFVVFPANGHGAIGSAPCSFEMMAAFVNNPNQPLDTSCAQEGEIEFVTAKNTLMAPGTVWLSRSVLDYNFMPVLQRTLLLVLLILFPPVWLTLWWLSRRQRNRSTPVSPGAKLAPWLGVLLALLSIGWIVLQAVGAGATALTDSPNFILGFNRIFIGIDRDFAWIYGVPILMALASIGMVGLAVLAWRNQYWDKKRRLYYSFTAGVAIAYTLFLAAAGQLTVFF